MDGQAWVRFRDSGPGIPPDEQEKIFLPFFRGSQGRRIKDGMGLGLSIARDLARAHGGEIGVESKLGSGSTFTLWLPIDEGEENGYHRVPDNQ
jgi:signal transduction histidine kinase